jgi:dipeptidyl aminopeptidase/acylaminoacyl peptidase
VLIFIKNAVTGFLVVDKNTLVCEELPLNIVETALSAIQRVSNTQFVVIGTTATIASALYLVDITDPGNKTLLKSTASATSLEEYCSMGKHISFPRTRGDLGLKGFAHAFFYKPANRDFAGPPGAKPPLIVWMHGGREYISLISPS